MDNQIKKVFITCKENRSLAEKTAEEIKKDPDFTKRMAEAINTNKKELKVQAGFEKGLLVLSTLNSELSLDTEATESLEKTETFNFDYEAFLVSVGIGLTIAAIIAAIKYGYNRARTPVQPQAQQVVAQGQDLAIAVEN